MSEFKFRLDSGLDIQVWVVQIFKGADKFGQSDNRVRTSDNYIYVQF